MYNLALNPHIQDKLYSEIDQHLPPDRVLTEAALKKMSYVKACVKETLRYTFPVAIGIERVIQEDLVIKDYLIPKGVRLSYIFLFIYVIIFRNRCIIFFCVGTYLLVHFLLI